MELLIVSIVVAVVAANLFLWREAGRLRAENKALRAAHALLVEAFRSVATDWATLLEVGAVRYGIDFERMSDDEYRRLLSAVKEFEEGRCE